MFTSAVVRQLAWTTDDGGEGLDGSTCGKIVPTLGLASCARYGVLVLVLTRILPNSSM